MAKQRFNKSAKIVSWIIIALVLIALIVGIVYLTHGGKADIKTFSMKVGNKLVLRDESNIALHNGEKFTVRSSSDYSVAVYAYTEYNDFEFEVDGEVKKWSDYSEVDFLTLPDSSLKADKQTDGFTLSFKSLASIISTEKSVVISDEVKGSEFDRFCLAVTSNGSTISICFHLSFKPANIELLPDDNIMFDGAGE